MRDLRRWAMAESATPLLELELAAVARLGTGARAGTG